MADHQQTSITALLSGACAGLAADVLLFPLDTLKTRLQSKQGIGKIYAGLGPDALASAPGASLFFLTYETVRKQLGGGTLTAYQSAVQMLAAGAGEVVACIVRVPTEIVKQRLHAQVHSSALLIVRTRLKQEGVRGCTEAIFQRWHARFRSLCFSSQCGKD